METGTSSTKQLTLSESYDRTQAWDINDTRAQRSHHSIGDMIALDLQPFSIVEDRIYSPSSHPWTMVYIAKQKVHYRDGFAMDS